MCATCPVLRNRTTTERDTGDTGAPIYRMKYPSGAVRLYLFSGVWSKMRAVSLALGAEAKGRRHPSRWQCPICSFTRAPTRLQQDCNTAARDAHDAPVSFPSSPSSIVEKFPGDWWAATPCTTFTWSSSASKVRRGSRTSRLSNVKWCAFYTKGYQPKAGANLFLEHHSAIHAIALASASCRSSCSHRLPRGSRACAAPCPGIRPSGPRGNGH
jgi:hypothetical protein